MKKSRDTEEQVAYVLRLAESGTRHRCLSPDGHRGGDLLPLEEEIRQPRRTRGPRVARKRRLSLHRDVVLRSAGRDQAWSMDFVHDQLVTGRTVQVSSGSSSARADEAPMTHDESEEVEALLQDIRRCPDSFQKVTSTANTNRGLSSSGLKTYAEKSLRFTEKPAVTPRWISRSA